MTAAPATRHQRLVVNLIMRFGTYAEAQGGEVLPAPCDVYFSETNVVEPDVIFIRQEHLGRVEKKFIRSAPDLVIEVSSPTTRRLELVRKRPSMYIGRIGTFCDNARIAGPGWKGSNSPVRVRLPSGNMRSDHPFWSSHWE